MFNLIQIKKSSICFQSNQMFVYFPLNGIAILNSYQNFFKCISELNQIKTKVYAYHQTIISHQIII